ncbi:MAG: 30S ribosomal protein S18 [Pyrinomonas sp.]|uniref:30S ribosomal protein S18 n=1 Tax=Pyrinomonas sp. TaxID=2080306 RepID=UPI003332082B
MATNFEDQTTDVEQEGADIARAVAPTGRTPRRIRRRKQCRFCSEKIDLIDYKDVRLLQPFIPERGKIMPRRISGVCAPHQRMLATAIKRARIMALIPFVAD